MTRIPVRCSTLCGRSIFSHRDGPFGNVDTMIASYGVPPSSASSTASIGLASPTSEVISASSDASRSSP